MLRLTGNRALADACSVLPLVPRQQFLLLAEPANQSQSVVPAMEQIQAAILVLDVAEARQPTGPAKARPQGAGDIARQATGNGAKAGRAGIKHTWGHTPRGADKGA